jgi:hypothetical protein
MRFTILFIISTLLAVSLGLRWEGTNENGHPVIRTFNVLASPAKGNPYTFTVLATQRQAQGKHKIQDAIEFTFSVVGLPHFTVRHFDRSTDTVEARGCRHALRKIVEYVESVNGTGGYEPGTDTKLQESTFWGVGAGSDWSALDVSNSSVNGANVFSVCSSNGVGVTICFYAADIWSQLTVNGSSFSVDPNSIHHTLNILNFPFLRSDGSSRLALKTHFEAVSRVVVLNDTTLLDNPNENALDLSVEGDDKKPVAAWDTTVSVTGSGCDSSADVLRSVLYETDVTADEDVNINTALGMWSGEVKLNFLTRITYLSFLTECTGGEPTDIFWDPDVGVVDNGSFASTIFPSLILLLALLSIVLL